MNAHGKFSPLTPNEIAAAEAVCETVNAGPLNLGPRPLVADVAAPNPYPIDALGDVLGPAAHATVAAGPVGTVGQSLKAFGQAGRRAEDCRGIFPPPAEDRAESAR